MSGDEFGVLFISTVIALIGWANWYWRLFAVHRLICGPTNRFALAILPLVCAGLLFAVLKTWAADDVRDAPRYLWMYAALGAAWVWIAAGAAPFLGYSARDDVLERRNSAAAWAVCGLLIALTCCFAGANVGNGPGWWVVVFSAALATAALFLLWSCFEWLTHRAEAVTVDRDVAAGLRLAAILVASGLILGRAVAGNWVSSATTVRDFVYSAWPVLPHLGLAVVVERILARARHEIPSTLLFGVAPAMIYLLGATAWLLFVGIGA